MSGNDRMSAIALTACGRGRGGNGDGAGGDASPSDKLRRFVEGGRTTGGAFCGLDRREVGGVFDGDGLAGAFGAPTP